MVVEEVQEIIMVRMIETTVSRLSCLKICYSFVCHFKDSYLAKMNYSRRNTQFKPYTGRDYEQFKKNFGFGTGYLAHDFENTTHKEKVILLFKKTNSNSFLIL